MATFRHGSSASFRYSCPPEPSLLYGNSSLACFRRQHVGTVARQSLCLGLHGLTFRYSCPPESPWPAHCMWPHSGTDARLSLPGLLLRVARFRYSCQPEAAWPAYCVWPHAGTDARLSHSGLPLCLATFHCGTVARLSLLGLLTSSGHILAQLPAEPPCLVS